MVNILTIITVLLHTRASLISDYMYTVCILYILLLQVALDLSVYGDARLLQYLERTLTTIQQSINNLRGIVDDMRHDDSFNRVRSGMLDAVSPEVASQLERQHLLFGDNLNDNNDEEDDDDEGLSILFREQSPPVEEQAIDPSASSGDNKTGDEEEELLDDRKAGRYPPGGGPSQQLLEEANFFGADLTPTSFSFSESEPDEDDFLPPAASTPTKTLDLVNTDPRNLYTYR